jgi:short-subunit dehydrogenase
MTTALSGANTIVTDADAGIGHAVALQLPSGGLNVIVHGRDAGRGDAVAREITGEGRSARFVAADLLDKREVARPMDEAADVERLITAADSARELDDHVLGLHPNGVNPDALWVSAQALKSAP